MARVINPRHALDRHIYWFYMYDQNVQIKIILTLYKTIRMGYNYFRLRVLLR